jgi:UBX domain-containing protein 1
LGSSAQPSESLLAPAPEPPQSGPVVVRVILWEDGFSVDDGPLRSFEDQESRHFLLALKVCLK